VDAELVVEGDVGEVQGQSPGGEEQPKSSIAKRVGARPRSQNPSSMQLSSYLHLDREVAKGKRKCGNVYTSQKQSKKDGGISAVHVAGTDMDVGGTPAGKVKRVTSNMYILNKQVFDFRGSCMFDGGTCVGR